MLPWVFDVDGVLCDTRQAVLHAYRAVGVDNADEAQGRPHGAWLKDERAHARKNALYPSYLQKHGRRSLVCDFINELQPRTFVGVLSAASEDAIKAVLSFVGLDVPILGSGCGADEKLGILDTLAPRGFYVDDRAVSVPVGWHLLVSDTWMR